MSSGTGDSRHYTKPSAARDAQIMTITAPATPSNGDVNGLPVSAPRAPSRHSGRRHRGVRSAWLPRHPQSGGCRQGGHVDWLAVHLRRVQGSALPPRLPLLPALAARQPGVAAAHAGAGNGRRAVRPGPGRSSDVLPARGAGRRRARRRHRGTARDRRGDIRHARASVAVALGRRALCAGNTGAGNGVVRRRPRGHIRRPGRVPAAAGGQWAVAPDADTRMAAHLVGEMAARSAWHRRHRYDGKLFDDQTARRTTIEFVRRPDPETAPQHTNQTNHPERQVALP
jgi:hypothetical protein